MSIATTLPQRSQGMILLSITSLCFRRARRRIDRSRGVFRSCAKSRFHLPTQFQPQGFEDCRSPRGHWVGWITNHFAGDIDSSGRHSIPAARCALIRPAHDAGKRTPRHRTDAASHKIRLAATESRSCSSRQGMRALFGIAPSRSTVDAGIGHTSSTVVQSHKIIVRRWFS